MLYDKPKRELNSIHWIILLVTLFFCFFFFYFVKRCDASNRRFCQIMYRRRVSYTLSPQNDLRWNVGAHIRIKRVRFIMRNVGFSTSTCVRRYNEHENKIETSFSASFTLRVWGGILEFNRIRIFFFSRSILISHVNEFYIWKISILVRLLNNLNRSQIEWNLEKDTFADVSYQRYGQSVLFIAINLVMV